MTATQQTTTPARLPLRFTWHWRIETRREKAHERSFVRLCELVHMGANRKAVERMRLGDAENRRWCRAFGDMDVWA